MIMLWRCQDSRRSPLPNSSVRVRQRWHDAARRPPTYQGQGHDQKKARVNSEILELGIATENSFLASESPALMGDSAALVFPPLPLRSALPGNAAWGDRLCASNPFDPCRLVRQGK